MMLGYEMMLLSPMSNNFIILILKFVVVGCRLQCGYLFGCGQFLGHVSQMWMLRWLGKRMVGTINYSKVFVFRSS
jgi:hypothetical protein